jgi:hypothetical protein
VTKYILSIFGGKNPVKSLTAWGLVVWSLGDTLVQTACGPTGLLPAETCSQLGDAVQALGGVLTALGVRKASTAKNVS